MSRRFPVARYRYTGKALLPSIPYVDPTPGEPPLLAQPGGSGERWMVAVGGFPFGARPVVLWGAHVQVVIRDRRQGANEVTVTAPCNAQTMRILGLPYTNESDGFGTQLYALKEAASWELLVGSSLDGKVRWRFVVRDQVEVNGNTVTIRGVGFVGGLTSDRIIGAPEPKNLLAPVTGLDVASGWVAHGAGTAFGVETGGPASDEVLWVTGTPDRLHYIEKTVIYKQPSQPWGRQRIASTSLVKLPGGVDIDDYGLATTAVFVGDTQVWPGPTGAEPDLAAGIVTSDMKRGSWITDPVIGIGYLPTPPFVCTVRIRLHPVDETNKVRYDGREIVRRENTSTVTAVDLTHHVVKLFDTFQGGRDKSDWGITAVAGAPSGIEEVQTWWHEDAQSGNDALEAIGGRGVDIWDLAGPGRTVKASARRGSDRTDLIVHEWDVCGAPSWSIDIGALRTALRASSGASSIWGGANAGAIDTSKSNGQIIDVALSAPVGMTPSQLIQWARGQLASLSTVPLTCTLTLRWSVGMRLMVGDAVRVALRANAGAVKDWFRVTEWAPDFDRRTVAVTFGTDPILGGN